MEVVVASPGSLPEVSSCVEGEKWRRPTGANITGIGDAVWWACETVTTVGYGDHYPVTTQGRFIAVALMVVGVSMVGAVTASVAAWMVKQVEQQGAPGGPGR